jgi:glycosyltransferase involved in cell wall biosynthesis
VDSEGVTDTAVIQADRVATPILSILVETWNADGDVTVKLQRLLDSLEHQTLPFHDMEVIVAVDEEAAGEIDELAEPYPNVETVWVRSKGVFGMNNAALDRARGRHIAYLHSDVVPSPSWAETLVGAIEAGADVSVGRTAYAPRTLLTRTTSLFDFGHVQRGLDGRATNIISNSLVLRRDVALRHRFEERAGSSGGCYLLARQLEQAGRVAVYVPEAFVAHDDDVSGFGFVRKRLRVGSDLVKIARLDSSRAIGERRLLKLGPLAPFAVAGSRVAFDARRFVRYRRELGIRPWALPYFMGSSVVMRSIELVGVAVEMARPGALGRRLGW